MGEPEAGGSRLVWATPFFLSGSGYAERTLFPEIDEEASGPRELATRP